MFSRKKKSKPFNTQKPISFNPAFLIVCQLVNIAPLVMELTGWMLSILGLCLLWQISIVKKVTNRPNTILIAILSISGCLLLVLTGKELGLLSTMVHLVALSYVLKAFEQRSHADFYQIALLGLFVLTTSLIFQQSIYFALAIAVIILINLVLITSVYAPSLTLSAQFKQSGKIVLFSIPLTVFLFIVFPKLSPLWKVPTAKSAETGLSDSLKVGDIANLALSNKLAFRATFNNQAPSYSELYWRAIVMEDFDGTSWRSKAERGEYFNRQFKENASYSTKGNRVSYQVIVSPTYQKWLFGLDVARVNQMETKGLDIIQRNNYTVYSKDPITQTSSYAVTSYTQSPMAINITDSSYDKNISIPKASNPKLVEKAEALRIQYPDNKELIKQVLATFNKESYRYTLKPPSLTNNSLDEFYFETKAGFCAHYASSFTFMMRAAGIPARMVTGYMGGEYNPQGGYYSIYQRDAHAWSEVWLRGEGWVRVDPTAAINPERVERGFSDNLLSEQADYSNEAFSLLRMSKDAWFINQLRLQLEALDYNWTRWVIGYSADKQNKFLQNIVSKIISLKDLKWLSILYGVLVVAVFILVGWIIIKIKQIYRPTDANTLYESLIQLLKQQGIIKEKGQTPQDFTLAINQQLPEISIEFSRFTQLYSALMYKKLTEDEHSSTLQSLKHSYQILSSKCK